MRNGKRVVVGGLSEPDSRFENNWMRRWRVDAASGTLRGTVTTSTKPRKGIVLDRAARRGGIWTCTGPSPAVRGRRRRRAWCVCVCVCMDVVRRASPEFCSGGAEF